MNMNNKFNYKCITCGKEYLEQEEDALSYALFPQVAETFFKYRQAQKYKIDSTIVNMEDKTHIV